MANLWTGKINDNGTYQDLEIASGITFGNNTDYTIQILNMAYIREGTVGDGFLISTQDPFLFKAIGNKIYIKPVGATCVVNIADNSLELMKYTFTITPTPVDAIVTINNEIRNSITVEDGTTITYSVEKENYITQSGTYTINGASYTLNVTLEELDPSETIWYLTAPTSEVIIDEADFGSMTTSSAFIPLWNQLAADGTMDSQNELMATSGTVGSEGRVWVNTSAMGIIETIDQTTGDPMYVTPLAAEDGDVYSKVAYNANDATSGNILYLRLVDSSQAWEYSYNLYSSNDGEHFQEANNGDPIPVNVVSFGIGG